MKINIPMSVAIALSHALEGRNVALRAPLDKAARADVIDREGHIRIEINDQEAMEITDTIENLPRDQFCRNYYGQFTPAELAEAWRAVLQQAASRSGEG